MHRSLTISATQNLSRIGGTKRPGRGYNDIEKAPANHKHCCKGQRREREWQRDTIRKNGSPDDKRDQIPDQQRQQRIQQEPTRRNLKTPRVSAQDGCSNGPTHQKRRGDARRIQQPVCKPGRRCDSYGPELRMNRKAKQITEGQHSNRSQVGKLRLFLKKMCHVWTLASLPCSLGA